MASKGKTNLPPHEEEDDEEELNLDQQGEVHTLIILNYS